MAGISVGLFEPKFTLAVLQLSSLCNLNCTYCYVPDRKNNATMSREHLSRIFSLTVGAENFRGHSFDFLFHAGEPTTLGLQTLRDVADQCIAAALPGIDYRFSIQTNGVLLNQEWGNFFRDYGFAVGVSVDGPSALNAARVDWAGRDTLKKSLRGIEALQKAGVKDIGCLATIGIQALREPDALMQFFIGLDVAALGFNLEDVENDNKITSFGAIRSERTAWYRRELVEPFFHTIFDHWWPRRDKLRVREFADILRASALRRVVPNYVRSPDCAREVGIITFMRDGSITTFAPEFAGAKAPEYDDFVVGHIDHLDSLAAIKENMNYQRINKDIMRGIKACEETCAYFPICGSSFVSNRWFEYRDFSRPDTFTCEMMRKAAADVCFSRIKAMQSHQPPTVAA